MSPHEPHRPEGPALSELSADTPLTSESALFVLSLHRDGRAVPAELLAAAREFARRDPATAAADADLAALSEVLSSEPLGRLEPAFTERVVAAARRTGSGPSRVIHLALAWRLATAAALLLALTLAYDASTPGDLMADDADQEQSYLGDRFRREPYGPIDLQAGLRLLVPGPLDGLTGEPAASADGEADSGTRADEATVGDTATAGDTGVDPAAGRSAADAAGGPTPDGGR